MLAKQMEVGHIVVEGFLVDVGQAFCSMMSEGGLVPADESADELPPDGSYRAALAALDELSRWLLREGNPNEVHELICEGTDLPVLGFWMIPLGIFVLSLDMHWARRIRRRFMIWLTRASAIPISRAISA